jgi:hypothetical protein
MMIRLNVKTRLACLAVTFLATASAQTGVWSPPVVLSTGGQGWEAAAAIDGTGNSVALWDERTSLDQLWSRSKTTAGNWGPVAEVSPPLETTSVFPEVRTSTAGFATAVWSDANGVWTADRPPASNWNPPQLLIPGVSSPIFVMNSQGAAAIAWTVGGPRSTTGSVMAVLRPAGGIWTSPEMVAGGAEHVSANHVGIGANGAVIVTWESYNAVCTKYGCRLSAFILHASRQNAGTGSWADSGSLLGPDGASHDVRVALDSSGGAALVAVNNAGAYASTTQGNAGGAWSPFKTIASPQGSTITCDLATDDAGQVTLVYEFIGFPTSQAFAVSGSISSNVWSSPAVISASDTSVGQLYFAVAPSGQALVIWLNSSATPAVRAVRRTTATGTWSSPITVSGPGNEIGPEAAAVNSSGNAIVIYSGYDAASVHTEYVTTYQP